MKYSRLLVLLTPVIILIFLESVIFFPSLFYSVLSLINLTVLATILYFLRRSAVTKNWGSYIGMAVLPLGFLTSIFVYSSILINKFVVQFLFFIAVSFVYFYLRNLYYYLIRPDLYKSYTLKNISSLGNFFLLFFSASAIYGLQSFLNLPVWLLMIFLLFVIFLAVYQIMWVNKIEPKTAFVYILISAVVLLEIGWATSFLPLNYNVVGLALAICYYVLVGLTIPYLNNSLSRKTIKLYLIFGFLSILLVFLTARWM